MKTLILITSMMALGLMGVGCSKSNSQSDNNANPSTPLAVAPIVIDPTPGTINSDLSTLSGGSTSTFTPVSLATMNEYVATHPLNNPTNFKVNVNLSQSTSGRYGGTVTISYLDNGIQYDGVFKAGVGVNQTFKNMYDNGRSEADYNYWFNFEKQLVFTGFFEDEYGAITVALIPESSSATSGNDGEPIVTTKYKGQIYFKNFTTTFAQHSPYRSYWFTYISPYDCRSNIIQTKCGLNPGAEAGYKLLGTFTGVDIKTGFNIL
jgi:hypothetical protein